MGWRLGIRKIGENPYAEMDKDVAAIAFYDDPNEQAHTFLYLENKGGMTFSPASTFAAENGKWITMEACDFDGDGDQDIILGSFVYTVGELTNCLDASLVQVALRCSA
jgi:hypothetical protein